MLPILLGLWTDSAAAPLVSGSCQLSESFFLTYYGNPPLLCHVSYREQLLALLFFQICFPFVHLLCSPLFMPFLIISLPQLRISAPHTALTAPFFDELFGTLSSSCYPSINFFSWLSLVYVPDVPVFSLSPARSAQPVQSQCSSAVASPTTSPHSLVDVFSSVTY